VQGFGQGTAHLGRALALGFGEQQLAHRLGSEWIGHQRPDFTGQPAPPGHKPAAATRQIGQEGQDSCVTAIDVVDQQQHRAPREQITNSLAAVFEGPGQQPRVIQGARHSFEERGQPAAVATRHPHEGVEQRNGVHVVWVHALRLPAARGGLAGVGDGVEQRRLA
jgi:hypothetical protein